jgi:hypothetical protein
MSRVGIIGAGVVGKATGLGLMKMGRQGPAGQGLPGSAPA